MARHLLQGGLGGETLVILEYAPAGGSEGPSHLTSLVQILMRPIIRRLRRLTVSVVL